MAALYIRLGAVSGPWAYWPVHGLLCGVLFRRPYRDWPRVVSAAVVAQLLTIYLVRGDLVGGASTLGALLGALEATLGAWVLCRRKPDHSPLEDLRTLALFMFFAVALFPLVLSPIIASAFAHGLHRPFHEVWWPVFVGQSLGMLLFAPLGMHSWSYARIEHSWTAQTSESAACLALTMAVSVAAFASQPTWQQYVILPYSVFPLLAWGALRSGPQWIAASIASLATVASWNTARGNGPFARAGVPMADNVFGLEIFLTFMALSGLLLSAVTEQRRRSYIRSAMQEAIRSAFFESSDTLIVLKDLTGRYLMVKSAVEELYGVPRARLIGQHPSEFLDSQSADTIAGHDARALAADEAREFDETLAAGAHPRQFVMTRFPVRDADGVTRYLGMIGRDETVQRDLEQRLQRAQRVELVGQTAAGLAHDLNNVLSVASGNVEMLAGDPGRNATEREMLGEVSEAIAHATNLTARLLALGRNTPVTAVVVNVDAALRELTPVLRALVRGHIELDVVLGAAGACVLADPSVVEQIVLNLVANARDAITGDGRVSVTTELRGSASLPDADRSATILLQVADSGVGMDEKTQVQAFDLFFTTKGPGKGTGLGLFTVAQLVRQAGGVVRLTSQPNVGTTATVELPVVGDSGTEATTA